jgi:hypothetical protein
MVPMNRRDNRPASDAAEFFSGKPQKKSTNAQTGGRFGSADLMPLRSDVC